MCVFCTSFYRKMATQQSGKQDEKGMYHTIDKNELFFFLFKYNIRNPLYIIRYLDQILCSPKVPTPIDPSDYIYKND